jgi:hypothetical protein
MRPHHTECGFTCEVLSKLDRPALPAGDRELRALDLAVGLVEIVTAPLRAPTESSRRRCEKLGRDDRLRRIEIEIDETVAEEDRDVVVGGEDLVDLVERDAGSVDRAGLARLRARLTRNRRPAACDILSDEFANVGHTDSEKKRPTRSASPRRPVG